MNTILHNLNETAAKPARVDTGDASGIERVHRILATVRDPEIPVLTIEDLGILRAVEERGGKFIITITPTYTGCPAMQTIEQDIHDTLKLNDVGSFEVITSLSPAWTTDWMSEAGRKKLLQYGIAPPAHSSLNKRTLLAGQATINCPQCNSADTSLVSEFGSTPCKALHRCNTCLEPFDYFKCL